MIPDDWDLFYDICNTMNKHYRQQNESKNSFKNSSASSLIMISMFSTFQVLDFLRLSMMYFKY